MPRKSIHNTTRAEVNYQKIVTGGIQACVKIIFETGRDICNYRFQSFSDWSQVQGDQLDASKQALCCRPVKARIHQ
jgi:hypothetical protein